MQTNESDGVASKKNQSAGRREKRGREETKISFACSPPHALGQQNSGSDGVVGAKQPLQQSRRGDMDDDGGFHPADRPPFVVCGLIYFSAVTSSAEA